MNCLFRSTVLVASILCLTPSSAFAALILYSAVLDGPSEAPPVESPGVGLATVGYDSVAHTLNVKISFSGLLGETTVAHIHSPTAEPGEGNIGVATFPGTFPGFPVGVTEGDYEGTWDLMDSASYTASFLNLYDGTAAGAEAGLIASMNEGRAYVNIHTTFAPGGEIRGFLQQVPEPSSLVLLGMGGTLGLIGYTWRRRQI